MSNTSAPTRAAIASMALVALPASLFAAELEGPACAPIHAEIVATQFTKGCTSAVGLCTMGTIKGNLGLNGVTQFVGDSLDAGLTTAPDAPATLAYSGVLHITLDSHETITLRDTGVFDTATGTPTGGFFTAFERIEGASGRFKNATGSIFSVGKTINGQLVARISGELCFD